MDRFHSRIKWQHEERNGYEDVYINFGAALHGNAMLEHQIRQQSVTHSSEVQALHEELREMLKLIRLLNSPHKQSTLNLTNTLTLRAENESRLQFRREENSNNQVLLQEENEMLNAKLNKLNQKLNSSMSAMGMLKCNLRNSEESRERLLQQINEMQRDFSMRMEELENELNKYRDRGISFRNYKSDSEVYIENLENNIRILKGNNKDLKDNIKISYKQNLALQTIVKKKTEEFNSLRGRLERYRNLYKDLKEQTQRYGEVINILEERLKLQEEKVIKKKLLDHATLKHLTISNGILNEELTSLRKQYSKEMMLQEENNQHLKKQLRENQEELDMKSKLLQETCCLLMSANKTIGELRKNVPRAAYECLENKFKNLRKKVSVYKKIIESPASDEEDEVPLQIDAPLDPVDDSTEHHFDSVLLNKGEVEKSLPSSREHINVLEQRISCLCIPHFSTSSSGLHGEVGGSSWQCQGCTVSTTRKANIKAPCSEETFTAGSIIEQASSLNIPQLDLSLVIQMKKSDSDSLVKH